MANRFLSNIRINDAYTFPASDGTNGQVISTDGSGNLSFVSVESQTGSTVIYQDNFSGDGSTVDFTLSNSVSDEVITQVYIDGVYQNKDTYSVSNTTLTFSTAPSLNSDVEVITFNTATTADDLQAGVVIIPVKNTHTASISKGEPVYITGNVGSSSRLEIAPADASDSAKMPAAGLLLQTLAVNEEGYAVTGGYLRNITTDTIDGTSTSSNDTVYVKSGGGLTMTKPTGSNLIQNIAKVARSASGNAGSLIVSSILRTNDVPNLTTGKIWVGSTNTVESTVIHLDESNNRLGINNTSPAYSLDVTGTANITGNITTSGTVDGVDISAFKTDYDSHTHTESEITDFGNYLTNVTHDTVNTKLVVTKRDGTTTDLSLSQYIDDTNLARLTSGTLNSTTGIATFTRDDATTFTVDFSALFDDTDTNDYVSSASFNTSDGVLTLTRTDAGTVTVDLDGRYLVNSSSGVNTTEPRFGYTTYTDPNPGVTRDAKFGDDGIAATEVYSSGLVIASGGNSTEWNTAYGWGNHADAGYLTSYTETDTLATVTARGNTTSTSITAANLYSNGRLYISSSAPIIELRDTDSTGSGINSFISYKDSGNSERGWIGFGSASNSIFGIQNTIGDIKLYTNTGVEGNLSVVGNILLTGDATTTNQGRTIDFTGFDKEGTTDFTDRAYIRHTINAGGHSGSVLEISSQNDANDGIAFTTHASSVLKHNGNDIITSATIGSQSVASAGNANTLDGLDSTQFLRSDQDDTMNGKLTLTDLRVESGASNSIRIGDGFGSGGSATIHNYQQDLYLQYGNGSSNTNLHLGGGGTQADLRLDTGGGSIIMNRDGKSGNSIEIDHVENSNWSFVFKTSSVGNDNHSGFWVNGDGTPDMRLRATDGSVKALIHSNGTSYIAGGNLLVGTANNLTSQALQVNGFVDVTNLDAALRFYNGSSFRGGFGDGQWATGNSSYTNDLSIITTNRFIIQTGGSNDPRVLIDSNGLARFNNGIRLPDTNGTINSLWGIYGWDSQLQFTKRNLSTDGYEGIGLLIDYNGLYVEAPYSLRSPIFYDSNNTAWYTNPADRSILNTLQLGGASSDTTNLKLDVQGNMAIRGGNGLYYGVTTNNYNSWTTRMYASGSTQYLNAQQFIFDNQGYGSTTFATINNNGVYANVYWDSSNTNYYVDAAATSKLAEIVDSRGSRYIANYHSGSDFTSGTLVATDIPASGTNGASFVIEVTGKSYSTVPPFSFMAQGYLYGGTIINASGVNNGDLRLTYIKVMELNGYLHFWWPRVSYWNSFEARVRDAGGSPINRVTGISNSSDPSGATKKVQINLAMSTLYGYNTNSGDLYAQTYYDANNTSYYLNPDSTSLLYSVAFNGTTSLNNNELRLVSLTDGNHYLKKIGTGYSGVNIDGPQLQGHQGGELTTNYTGNNWALRWSIGGNVTINNSLSINKSSQYGEAVNLTYSGSNSSAMLIRNNTGATATAISFFYSSAPQGARGSITVSSTSTAYNTSSDYRLKENVVPMTGSLERLDQLNPTRFNFIGDDKTVDGFLAHEAAEVVPEAVTGTKDEVDEEGNPIYQGIDQAKLVPLLVGAIQELKAEVEALKQQLNGTN